MGVPKFFRWISERYPTISQLIAENRIPEFDNLYVRPFPNSQDGEALSLNDSSI